MGNVIEIDSRTIEAKRELDALVRDGFAHKKGSKYFATEKGQKFWYVLESTIVAMERDGLTEGLSDDEVFGKALTATNEAFK